MSGMDAATGRVRRVMDADGRTIGRSIRLRRPRPRPVFLGRDPVGARFRVESFAKQVLSEQLEDQPDWGDRQEVHQRQQDPRHHVVQDHGQLHPGPFEGREGVGPDDGKGQEQRRRDAEPFHPRGLRPARAPQHNQCYDSQGAGHDAAELAGVVHVTDDLYVGLEDHFLRALWL